MKIPLLIALGLVLLSFRLLAQPGTYTIVQAEDNQSQVISLATNEVVEILMAYDFYGAGSSLAVQKGKARFQVVPGNAAGGLPHCVPQPFQLAGPAEIAVQSGNTQGARTQATPLVVTLEIRRIRPSAPLPVSAPPAQADAKPGQ